MIKLPLRLIAKKCLYQHSLYPPKLKWTFATFTITKTNIWPTPLYLMDAIYIEDKNYNTAISSKYEGGIIYYKDRWCFRIINEEDITIYIKSDETLQSPIGGYDGIRIAEL